MREEWRDIKGFEGYYQVSNLGNVKSLERKVWNGRGRGYYKIVPEKILKAYSSNLGYLSVKLCRDDKEKTCTVHRLVAEAFIPNPQGLPEVNHIDENKENNCVENLEYCTRAYNVNYGTRNTRARKSISKAMINNPKNSKPVFSVDKESGLIMWWQSAKEAERQLGVAQQSICACCKGKAKSAGGFYWIYAEEEN